MEMKPVIVFVIDVNLTLVTNFQFWRWKWTRLSLTAWERFTGSGTHSTKHASKTWIISLSIGFWFWNVAQVHVEKLKHSEWKVWRDKSRSASTQLTYFTWHFLLSLFFSLSIFFALFRIKEAAESTSTNPTATVASERASHVEDLIVTPFAQILASLRSVRNNLYNLTNVQSSK